MRPEVHHFGNIGFHNRRSSRLSRTDLARLVAVSVRAAVTPLHRHRNRPGAKIDRVTASQHYGLDRFQAMPRSAQG